MSANLFALLKAATGEAGLQPRLGKWRQAVSRAINSILFDLPYVVVQPTGGDDSSRIQAAVNQYAGRKIVLLVEGATYSIGTTVTLPSNLVLYTNNATINASPSGTYPLGGAAFRCGRGPSIASTTIATTTPGALTITVNNATGAVAGNYVVLASAITSKTATYLIEKVVGTSVTLERGTPKTNGFAPGDSATFYTSANIPQNILLSGGGSTINVGAGVVILSFQGARYCRISDFTLVASPSGPTDAFGIFNDGAYASVAESIHCDGYNYAGALLGLAIQAGDECELLRCTARNVSGYALAFVESYQCTMRDCQGSGSGQGLVFSNDVVTTAASDWCTADNCILSDNVNEGVYLFYASSFNTLTNVQSNNNGSAGFRIGDGTHNSQSNKLVGCRASGNTGNALRIGIGSKGTVCENIQLDDSISHDLLAEDEVYIDGATTTNSVNTSGKIWAFTGAVDSFVSNFKIVHGATAAAAGLFWTSAGRQFVNNGEIVLSKNGDLGFWQTAAGLICVERVRVDPGAAAGTFGLFTQGGSIRIGIGVDVGACATPFSPSGGFLNVGTLIANGAGTPQSVTFADIKTTDSVAWIRTVNGGAPGVMPLTVITPGTGLAATFAAGDTGTYLYKIN